MHIGLLFTNQPLVLQGITFWLLYIEPLNLLIIQIPRGFDEQYFHCCWLTLYWQLLHAILYLHYQYHHHALHFTIPVTLNPLQQPVDKHWPCRPICIAHKVELCPHKQLHPWHLQCHPSYWCTPPCALVVSLLHALLAVCILQYIIFYYISTCTCVYYELI
jgi:hypothetical protein